MLNTTNPFRETCNNTPKLLRPIFHWVVTHIHLCKSGCSWYLGTFSPGMRILGTSITNFILSNGSFILPEMVSGTDSDSDFKSDSHIVLCRTFHIAQIRTSISNSIATLYYAEHFTLHRFGLRFLLSISVQDRNLSQSL